MSITLSQVFEGTPLQPLSVMGLWIPSKVLFMQSTHINRPVVESQ